MTNKKVANPYSNGRRTHTPLHTPLTHTFLTHTPSHTPLTHTPSHTHQKPSINPQRIKEGKNGTSQLHLHPSGAEARCLDAAPYRQTWYCRLKILLHNGRKSCASLFDGFPAVPDRDPPSPGGGGALRAHADPVSALSVLRLEAESCGGGRLRSGALRR